MSNDKKQKKKTYKNTIKSFNKCAKLFEGIFFSSGTEFMSCYFKKNIKTDEDSVRKGGKLRKVPLGKHE